MEQKEGRKEGQQIVARFRRTSIGRSVPLSAGERSFLSVSHKSDSSFAEKLVTLVHALAPPARLSFVNFPQQCRLDAAQACKGSALAELCNRYPKPVRIFFCTCSFLPFVFRGWASISKPRGRCSARVLEPVKESRSGREEADRSNPKSGISVTLSVVRDANGRCRIEREEKRVERIDRDWPGVDPMDRAWNAKGRTWCASKYNVVGDREKETMMSHGEATKGVPGQSREIKAMNDATRQVHRGTFNEWFAPRLLCTCNAWTGPIDEKATRLAFLSPRSIHVRISFLPPVLVLTVFSRVNLQRTTRFVPRLFAEICLESGEGKLKSWKLAASTRLWHVDFKHPKDTCINTCMLSDKSSQESGTGPNCLVQPPR